MNRIAIITTFAALGLGGCNDSEEAAAQESAATATATEAAEEAPAAAAPAAEAAAAAAPAANDNPIVGTWSLDQAGVQAELDSLSDEEAKLALGLFMAMSPSLEFRADNTFTMSAANPFSQNGARQEKTGTFEITSREANTLTLRATENDQTKTITITLVDPTHIRMQNESDPAAMLLVKS